MPKIVIIIMVNGLIIIILTIHIMGKITGKIQIKTMIKKELLVIAIQDRPPLIITPTIVVNMFQKFIILLIAVFMV
jgi:hypothetical protein